MNHSESGYIADVSEVHLAQLRRSAEDVLELAYAPYSGFPVGAAILTETGRIFQGCNIENAAYPSGLCAEAAAIAQMVASLGPTRIRAAYIACKGHYPAWPCGNCRQRLNEFAAPGMWVYTSTAGGTREAMGFEDLLPHSFGAANLEGIGR